MARSMGKREMRMGFSPNNGRPAEGLQVPRRIKPRIYSRFFEHAQHLAGVCEKVDVLEQAERRPLAYFVRHIAVVCIADEFGPRFRGTRFYG
tara:strand:+ start:254 stop:529 length:276 start_codon:yes stop_codon:yes gene_type:complete